MARQTRRGVVAGAAVLFAALVAAQPAMTQETTTPQVDSVKIRIIIGGEVLLATLDDNASARDFASLLPLSVTLEDYAKTEKIVDLPKRLDISDAPAGIDPAVGDITYYAPWGNLAIFYRDFGYAKGLVKLGAIDSGVGALGRGGSLAATIELVEGE